MNYPSFLFAVLPIKVVILNVYIQSMLFKFQKYACSEIITVLKNKAVVENVSFLNKTI